MSMTSVIRNIVDEKMKFLHVAFLAKVLSISGDKAKIQPLGLIRDYGETAKKQAVITGVHISQSARYKFTTENIDYVTNVSFSSETANKSSNTFAKATPISVGDVVLCVCCDRNIDAALRGENSLPPIGYHNQSDCVIVSII